MSKLLIEAPALRQMLSDPALVVFDVRYSLSDPGAGEQAYLNGHIPDAYFLDQGSQLAGQSTGTNGRHPLPDPQGFRRLMQDYGVTSESVIVVYDHKDSSFAARAWWLLRWQGYTQVRILNGGLLSWQDNGGALQHGARPAAKHDVATHESVLMTMSTVSAATILTDMANGTRTLVDARNAERYRGEAEPIDPVAGRIDGALNRPIAQNVQPDGRFKPEIQLREEFTALLGSVPVDQVVHYCGSGITACHNLFAMELAGLSGSALYPGSWSEWCSDPGRPVARG